MRKGGAMGVTLGGRREQEDAPQWLAVGLVLCLAAFHLARLFNSLADQDLWAYLAFGRRFWQEPGFPWLDRFSYLPVKDVLVYHEWLTGVLFSRIWELVGPAGIQVLKYLAALGALGLAGRAALRRGGGLFAVALALVLVRDLFGFGYSPVRAQVFTYLFFSLTILILEDFRAGRDERHVYILIPVVWLWSNLHGGFPAGIGLIGLYGAAEALSRRPFGVYLKVLAVGLVVTLVNPYGIGLWGFLHGAVVSVVWSEVVEWHSVAALWRVPGYSGLCLLLTVLVGISAVLVAAARRRDLPAILVLGVTAVLAFRHVRHVVLFALAFAVYVPSFLQDLLDRLGQTASSAGAAARQQAWAGMALLGLVACLAGWDLVQARVRGNPLDLRPMSLIESVASRQTFYYPAGGVDYIKARQLTGRVLTDLAWGSYLSWELYPSCLVGVDGRGDVIFPDHIHDAYFRFHYLKDGWRRFLEEYPPDILLLMANWPGRDALVREMGWREAYRDVGCAVYLRAGLAALP